NSIFTASVPIIYYIDLGTVEGRKGETTGYIKSTLSNHLHLQMKIAAERRNQKIIDAQFVPSHGLSAACGAENIREFSVVWQIISHHINLQS
ncbi:hypothetical protein WUBG_16688, partial [Wuchereria bancrofti]